jgi:hypothetical protein
MLKNALVRGLNGFVCAIAVNVILALLIIELRIILILYR